MPSFTGSSVAGYSESGRTLVSPCAGILDTTRYGTTYVRHLAKVFRYNYPKACGYCTMCVDCRENVSSSFFEFFLSNGSVWKSKDVKESLNLMFCSFANTHLSLILFIHRAMKTSASYHVKAPSRTLVFPIVKTDVFFGTLTTTDETLMSKMRPETMRSQLPGQDHVEA